jgi:hypothetical protein
MPLGMSIISELVFIMLGISLLLAWHGIFLLQQSKEMRSIQILRTM